MVQTADGAAGRLRIERTLVLGGGRRSPALDVEVVVTNVGDVSVDGRLAVEWNVMLLGGGGNPAAWWELPDGRIAHDAAAVAPAVDRLAQGNDWLGIRIETAVTPPADAWISPIETVSNSESGFERVYQGSCLVLSRPVSLRPGSAAGLRIAHAVSVETDRAAREPPREAAPVT
jgi:4-alpha-glucanotransferase